MPRPKSQFPTYCKHPQQHSARCWLNGQWVALGRYDSPESRTEFARICAEVAASGQPAVAARVGPRAVTTAELIAAFKVHVESHHRRPDGTPTTEVKEYKGALRVVRELYGHTPARDFGPVALQAVRDRMVKELGTARSREDILAGAKRTKRTGGPTTNYDSTGGMKQADADFDSLHLSDDR